MQMQVTSTSEHHRRFTVNMTKTDNAKDALETVMRCNPDHIHLVGGTEEQVNQLISKGFSASNALA